jgi:hypothetical protein
MREAGEESFVGITSFDDRLSPAHTGCDEKRLAPVAMISL